MCAAAICGRRSPNYVYGQSGQAKRRRTDHGGRDCRIQAGLAGLDPVKTAPAGARTSRALPPPRSCLPRTWCSWQPQQSPRPRVATRPRLVVRAWSRGATCSSSCRAAAPTPMTTPRSVRFWGHALAAMRRARQATETPHALRGRSGMQSTPQTCPVHAARGVACRARGAPSTPSCARGRTAS